jgi:SUKH-4 immunity protein
LVRRGSAFVGHIRTMTSATPKRIEILPESIGDVVARHVELGRVAGEFTRVPTGEIYFHYVGDGRRWYVNKSMSAFCEAAAIFNRCCEFHGNDEDTDDPKVWATVATQLRSDLESIEPLGDSTSSLWSATLEDSECGLLSLC